MPWVIWCDSFSPFEVIVDFPAVEDIEYELSSWMHEMLIDVIHIVIDYDIAYSFFFVCFKAIVFLQYFLVDFVVILRVFVLMLEKERENNCP